MLNGDSSLCQSVSHTQEIVWQITRCPMTQQLFLELGEDKRCLPPPHGGGVKEPSSPRLLNFATMREARYDAGDAEYPFAVSNFMTKCTGSSHNPWNRGNIDDNRFVEFFRCKVNGHELDALPTGIHQLGQPVSND